MEQEPKFESPPKYGHNLLELTLEEKRALKERVEKWQGLVRIFVHPMYEKWRGHEQEYVNDPENIKLVQIERVLSKLLAMGEDKTPPTIIMEEEKYTNKLATWLKNNPNGSSQDMVYFIKTLTDNPAPKIETKNKTQSWKILSRALKEIGVKKILIGGMQLEVSYHKKDWTNKDPFLARCVGIAMSYLSKEKAGEFEVELSALTAPTNERNAFIEYKRKS